MKKRVLSALLALCLTLSLAGAAFAENEASGASSSAASQAVSSVEPESQAQDKTVSSSSASGEDQTGAKTESTPAPTQTPAASDVTKEESESTVAPEATEEPEATAETDATPAPTEDPEAEVTEKTETDGSVEYTAALETDDQTLNVFVTAPNGAFAEGVEPQLSVTMLTAEDELNDVANKLDTAKVQYDGFTALDITFTDKATGEEIEPVQQVSVRIELPQTIVDSGIDLNTLAVQHLEEDENGDVKNVTEVATLDNGITLSEEAAAAANEAAGVAPMSDMPAEEATAGDAAETPAAVAEFEVDGFSSFVITWVDYEAGEANYASINVVLWDDQAGKELDAPLFNTSWSNPLQDNTTKTASDLVGDNQYITVTENGEETTYEYNNATYTVTSKESGRIDNEGDFRQIRANRGGKYGRYYAYINGSRKIRFNDYSITVYLHYDTTTITPDPGTDTPSATITAGKSAVKLDGDNYTLNLSVTGDRGNKIDKQKMDVLFILDESNSMRYDFGWINSQKVDRIAAAKYAIGEIVGAGYGHTNGLSQNTALDVEYALVGFYGGENDEGYNNSHNDATSHVNGNWTKSATTLYNSTPGSLSDRNNGGTNYEAGFYKGNELLNMNRPDREDAIKVVIFISDGVPGYYYNNSGETTGSGQPGDYNPNKTNSNEYKAVHNAMSELQKMDIDYFYFVGVGSNSINSDVYKDIVSAAAVPTTNKGSVEASSTDDLVQKFRDIQEKLTFYLADNVKMTDPLSENAELVAEANGENAGKYKFTIKLEHRENVEADYVALGSKDVYIQLDDNGTGTAQVQNWTVGSETIPSITVKVENYKTIKVEFDSEYRLAQNYRYTVSTTITPSSSAIAAGAAGYDGTGEGDQTDLKTGTHSGQVGYFSNDNDHAIITYDAITTDKDGNVTARSDGEPVHFPKPVIQVPEVTTGSLSLTKQLAEVSQDLVPADTGFSFTISIPAGENDANAKTYNASYTMAEGSEQTAHSGNVTFGKVENTDTATATVTLYAGETVVISDLPEVDVTINETTLGYEAVWDGATATNAGCTVVIDSDQPAVVTCINTLQTGSLTIDKNIAGLPSGTTVTGQTYTFNIDGPDTLTATIDGVTFTSGNATVTIDNDGQKIIAGLPKASYTITETTPNLDITVGTGDSAQQYYFADVAYGNNSSGEPNYDVNSATVDLTKEAGATVTVTNKYEPYKTVIITKVVDNGAEADIGMGDRTKLFAFTTKVNGTDVTLNTENVTLTTLDDPANENDAFNAAWTEDGYSLAHGGTLRIEKLKATDVVSFTESDYTGEGYTTSYTVSAGNSPIGDTQTGGSGSVDLDSNVYADYNEITVTVTNNRKVVAPTGLEDNHTKPFGLMVGVAVMAGLALAGGAVVRRRRRWME